MNKEINDLDRIIIGVREWAAEKTLDYGYFNGYTEERVIVKAKELEEYVLRGIVEKETKD